MLPGKHLVTNPFSSYCKNSSSVKKSKKERRNTKKKKKLLRKSRSRKNPQATDAARNVERNTTESVTTLRMAKEMSTCTCSTISLLFFFCLLLPFVWHVLSSFGHRTWIKFLAAGNTIPFQNNTDRCLSACSSDSPRTAQDIFGLCQVGCPRREWVNQSKTKDSLSRLGREGLSRLKAYEEY